MSNDDKRGKLLSELRKGKNLTQRDLGDLIGYTDKNISKWERGISFPNNPNIINKLAEMTDMDYSDMDKLIGVIYRQCFIRSAFL